MFLQATRPVVAVAVLWLAFAGARSAAAQPMTLVDQERSVFGFVIVPQCGGDDSETKAAQGFEPFSAQAKAALRCDTASGLASAEQQSTLSNASLHASGQTRSRAEAIVGNTIHAISISSFEVDFSLVEATDFRLQGLLRSASSAAFILGGADVRLTGAGGEIFGEQVIPEPGGEPTVLSFDEEIRLPPGSYTLRATANSVIDNTVPPNRFVRAAYLVTFDALSRPR